ncbi:hypothetical protein [Neisseria wadsworthii]|uniref:Lipoprotein n=1 Tax=Neisseria wadsworthii 9715 TaxID=1030841 RepID=G4CSH3_9NEIS|nr:hypothetical protein [Neisseria wadsworthii]EGZ44789.1 hypothetical protein HMPREF9370_2033 [Neisseria wadsworthii 9715]QMT35658.1 hypothetical protein H3L96_11730 [Neisseria wadsworthii]
MNKNIIFCLALLGTAACQPQQNGAPKQQADVVVKADKAAQGAVSSEQKLKEYQALLAWEAQAGEQIDGWMQEWRKRRAAHKNGRLADEENREMAKQAGEIYGSINQLNIHDAEVKALQQNLQKSHQLYIRMGDFINIQPKARTAEMQQAFADTALLTQQAERLKNKLNQEFGIKP